MAPHPERASSVRASEGRGARRSAVVLDDTPEARAMVVTVLRDGGFEVFEAATGADALELAHTRAPDLIVANPLIAGEDGDEFALALGVDPAITTTPVVFSAGIDDARAVWCLAEACDVSHILITPCEPDVIARFVGEIFGPEPIEPARLAEHEQL